MAWFGLAKMALQAGTHIYKKRQETKMAMADAQHMHAKRMADGQEAYQGKLLEARQSDWKDEAVLLILSAPIVVLAWAVVSDDPTAISAELRPELCRYRGLQICGSLSWRQFMESREHKFLGMEEKNNA